MSPANDDSDTSDPQNVVPSSQKLRGISIVGPIIISLVSVGLNFLQFNKNSEIQERLSTAELQIKQQQAKRLERKDNYIQSQVLIEDARVSELERLHNLAQDKLRRAMFNRSSGELKKDRWQIADGQIDGEVARREIETIQDRIVSARARRADLEKAIGT